MPQAQRPLKFFKHPIQRPEEVSSFVKLDNSLTISLDRLPDYAPPLRRSAAFSIDIVILSALGFGISLLTRWIFWNFVDITGHTYETLMPLMLSVESISIMFAAWCYFTISHWYSGATVGKWALGLRVFYKHSHLLPFSVSAWRSLAYLLSVWTYGIGFLCGLFRKDRRSIHDMVTNTCVRDLR